MFGLKRKKQQPDGEHNRSFWKSFLQFMLFGGFDENWDDLDYDDESEDDYVEDGDDEPENDDLE